VNRKRVERLHALEKPPSSHRSSVSLFLVEASQLRPYRKNRWSPQRGRHNLKLLRHRRERGHQMRKAHLVIGTVSHCNAWCITCPTTRSTRGVMPFELWRSIIDQVEPLREKFAFCSISIFGEPLLDRSMARKVDHYNSVFPKGSHTGARLPLYLNTNGFLLDERRSEMVLAGFDIVVIHIESHLPDVYRKLVPGLGFERVLENVRKLTKMRDRIAPSFFIKVATPLHRLNVSERETYERFWKNEGVNEVSFEHLSNRTGELKTFDDLKLEHANDVQPRCPASIADNLIIDWDGAVLLCCQDFERKLTLGNATAEPVSDLFKSSRRVEMAQLLAENRHSQLPTCHGCLVSVALF
jgi:radical SAM protein with 4Fe4S-binding SPASM domain